jgi:Ca2+-binding EF-hand superfamily protein
MVDQFMLHLMFQAFTHPESSHSILAQEAEDLFVRHDANGDGTITEEEFLKDPFIEFEQVINKSRINQIDQLRTNPKSIYKFGK